LAVIKADIVEALVYGKSASDWNSVSAFILRFDLTDLIVDSPVP